MQIGLGIRKRKGSNTQTRASSEDVLEVVTVQAACWTRSWVKSTWSSVSQVMWASLHPSHFCSSSISEDPWPHGRHTRHLWHIFLNQSIKYSSVWICLGTVCHGIYIPIIASSLEQRA